jgi:tetratricopeptide (TPR) repeat protein
MFDEYGKRVKTPSPVAAGYHLMRLTTDPSLFNRYVDQVVANKAALPPSAQELLTGFVSSGYAEQGRVHDALKVIGPLDDFQKINRYTDQPFYPVSREVLTQTRDRLLRYDSVANGTSPDQILKPHLRLYHLAVVSCRMQDYSAASAYARRMEALKTPQPWAKAIRDMGKIVDAQIDLQNGHAAAALQKLDATDVFPPFDILDVLRFGNSRFLWRAEALYQAGRYQDAIGMFANMDLAYGIYQPYLTYRLLRTAQSNDALRNYEQARLQYSQFLTLFAKPDPEFQPVVNRVRQRLAELQRNAG